MFFSQAEPPNIQKIPVDDAVGVTVVLITGSYREQEFVRVGYYVTNEYSDMEMRENPPAEPQFDKLVRTIAANEPRVTKFKINWDSSTEIETPPDQDPAISSNNDIDMGEQAGRNDLAENKENIPGSDGLFRKPEPVYNPSEASHDSLMN